MNTQTQTQTQTLADDWRVVDICHDIEGAPFHIGARVRVVDIVDDTASRRLIGRVGTVRAYDYHSGLGQSYPGDPMVIVDLGRKIETFWPEELALHERNHHDRHDRDEEV